MNKFIDPRNGLFVLCGIGFKAKVVPIDKLLKITELDEVWLDTDEMEIINIANDYGFKNFKYL